MIVHRTDMRDTIGGLLSKMTHQQVSPSAAEELPEETAGEEEESARAATGDE